MRTVTCNAMAKLCYLIIFPILGFLNANGQVKIVNPTNIPLGGQFDSIRIKASKFIIVDNIINSKADFDLRIYRFMAFGDYKLIRISTYNKNNLKIDIYSLNRWEDSLIYHKSLSSSKSGSKAKELINKNDILNIPNLDFDFIKENSLPIINDGNIYEVEAKVGRSFTFKEFNNPETYSQHSADIAKQSKIFMNFIKKLEKMLEVKISEPEL